MRKFLLVISLLGLAVFLSSGCTGQAPSTGQPITLLKPEVTVPNTCPITPVFTGASGGSPDLDSLPWMKAEPASSGIVAYLFFVLPGFATTHTYGPLHTGGGYPDGRSTKILWYTVNPRASHDLQIAGKKLTADHATFQQTFPMATSPGGDYPDPGCWQLQVQSGTDSGAVTVWVV